MKKKLEKRALLVTEARAIVDLADKEERALTSEEEQKYDEILIDVGNLTKEIEREQKLLETEARLSKATSEPIKPEGDKGADKEKEFRATAFRKFLKIGLPGLNVEEERALSSGVDAEGGYTIPPQEFVADLIKKVDDAVFIRQLATKYTLTKAKTLGFPSLEADPSDAEWTTELKTGSDDTTMSFGKREFTPNPFAKRIRISKDLINTSAIAIEDIVRDRFVHKYAVTEEKAYLTGNGTGKPLGLFVASANGIPTTRDVSEDNTTTSIKFDGLINAKYLLKAQYLARASWIFHRDALKQLAKLKYTDGKYIWEQSVQVGQPDRLLGKPLFMSEYAPNTFTAGLYVGIIGDFSFYWIVDSLDLEMQRLVELYAETNQIGYISRKKGDGMPVLAEAFARVQLASGS